MYIVFLLKIRLKLNAQITNAREPNNTEDKAKLEFALEIEQEE